MSQEMIIWILSAVLGGIDITSLIFVALFIVKGVGKKVEDFTGLKKEVSRLTKQNSELLIKLGERDCKIDALMLEMKGIRSNGSHVGKNREIKK